MTKDKEIKGKLEDIYTELVTSAPEKELQKRIERKLNRCGIMYRVFSRIKERKSIDIKLEKKWEKYKSEGKKMQDIIGIRIVLYFKDDIEICIRLLKELFEVDNYEHDRPDTETFKPQRINYVFRIPQDVFMISEDASQKCLIDNTFEVQVRTIFSEGWHEVEHDIRYKYKEDWEDEEFLSREFNGLMAVLEVCDNNILSICNDVAYKKYKQNEWEAMIRNKFRLRFQHTPLNSDLKKFLDTNPGVGKELFRFERKDIIEFLCNNRIPLTCDNLVYIFNEISIRNSQLHEFVPDLIKEMCIEQ